MGRHFRRALFSTWFFMVLTIPAGAESYSKDQLREEAIIYLELLDQGRFAEAWQVMSPIFQALEPRVQWHNRQQAIRAAYGALEFREFFLMEYRDHYLLSPDGEYIIVQFKTSFQHKATTTETVVLDCSAATECSIREYIIR
jgi:hypothetical protein